MADKLKFALALALLIAGLVGFYLLAGEPMILRVLSVLAGLGLGAALAWTTGPGRQFAVFARESVAESRKVVWPTRKETVQATALVFVFVVFMAAFLWLTDKSLEWALYDLILGWKKS